MLFFFFCSRIGLVFKFTRVTSEKRTLIGDFCLFLPRENSGIQKNRSVVTGNNLYPTLNLIA